MTDREIKAGAWMFAIDVGGTFTDCIARRPDGALTTHKLLSTGVYKGQVGKGSTATVIVDLRRRGDPPEFFEGWRLSLWDANAGRPLDEVLIVQAFNSQSGEIILERPLAVTPQPGMRYELECGEEAPLVGIRWLLGKKLHDSLMNNGGLACGTDSVCDADSLCGTGFQPVVAQVRLGTTRGTNALLERQGARTAFVTTAGFADVLRIGYQARPRLFDLHIRKPAELYEAALEIDERIDARGQVLKALDENEVLEKLSRLRAAGIVSLAVCLLNSYRNPTHEQRIGQIARAAGFEYVSVSSRLAPLQRLVPRGETTVVDAYLTPVIREYVAALQAAIPRVSLKLMTSAGGLVDAAQFVAKDSILSGPAAGVVGCARVAQQAGFEKAIGFDMGGTSTDVSRFDGAFERRYEMQLRGADAEPGPRIVAPMLAIETVAAGGGSVCDFDGVKPVVGPRSAGANPGPACYGRGGPLCITDVNLYLGRIPAEHFPFPLDRAAVERRLEELISKIEVATGRRYQPEELAAGYLAIADARMAAAIKKVSTARGYDPREYVLVSFGGAGGQHACAVARELGIRKILLHPLAGLLSAYGVSAAEITKFAARDVGRLLEEQTPAALEPVFQEMETVLRPELRAGGFSDEQIRNRRLLDLRYRGQDATITVPQPPDGDWRGVFETLHRQLYGFIFTGRAVEVFAARLEATGESVKPARDWFHRASDAPLGPKAHTRVCFNGQWRDTPLLSRESLQTGVCWDGPAIVVEPHGTIVVEPGWTAELTARGDLILTDQRAETERFTGRDSRESGCEKGFSHQQDLHEIPCDPVALELFNNHFSAIAEQMGVTLQKTAYSTNIKERLDFSCAIYDAQGDLVAHAPHIPVHIGAMGQCVKCLLEDWQRDPQPPPLRPGEVYITNHPYRGGSHLPDVTVITPVFEEDGPGEEKEILFFVANRAHHAEIGGIVPGSMPPSSRNLAEEGVLISGLRMRAGDETELRRLLCDGPYPSRAVEQNLADMQAQFAANQCGSNLLREMLARHGLATVQAYMAHIQQAAEAKMRAALRKLPSGEHSFTDYLDDGAPVMVKITIREDEAIIDFTGTGPVLAGNLNATPAIVASAVLYCFRCLIDEDIPLNAGIMKSVRIFVPEGFLNPPLHDDPAQCAAVVGGNVETSQRIVDVIFGALGVVAASQGTMNNLAFGNARFGYYETICGGAGAGPTFDGASAVHTHMTNTRLTDPEVLEDRYPVRLKQFAIRRGSGGAGAYRGGDGIVREIEFLEPLEVSLLTQRRTRPPYGLVGGQPGQPGRNFLFEQGISHPRILPSLSHFQARLGDVLRLETPGGGGFASKPV